MGEASPASCARLVKAIPGGYWPGNPISHARRPASGGSAGSIAWRIPPGQFLRGPAGSGNEVVDKIEAKTQGKSNAEHIIRGVPF